MIILKRLMTKTRLYLNTQYPFHTGSNESYCCTYEPRKTGKFDFDVTKLSDDDWHVILSYAKSSHDN